MRSKLIGQSPEYYMLYEIQRKLEQITRIAPGIGWSTQDTPIPTAQQIATSFKNRVIADGGVVEAEQCLIDRITNLKTLGLWDKASAIWLPHGYKEGKLYSAKGGATADFSFSRNGTRYRKGPTYVEQVPYNLLSRSEEFDNAVWTKADTTVVSNNIINPINGDLTADRIVETATTSVHQVYQNHLVTAAGDYTLSVYVKAGERSWISLNIQPDSTPSITWFDLTNGVVGTNAVGNTATITSLGDGWYRCSISRSAINSITNFYTAIRLATGDNVSSYTGNSSNGLYLFGAQFNNTLNIFNYFKTTTRFNVPALDYTNSTCPALSLEPARTNSLLQSEVFGTTWTNLNVTITSNVIPSPDGLSTADKIIGTSSLTEHGVRQNIIKAASALTYTLSCYAKKGEQDFLRLQLDDGVGNGLRTWFDLNTGVTGTSGQAVGTGFTHIASNIEAQLDSSGSATGWYRCIITATSNTTTTLRSFIYTNNNNGEGSFTGNDINGLYVYGAQLEQGSYVTSYIPTTTATVSRIADSVTRLTGVSSLIGQTEGTIYFEGSSFTDGLEKSFGLSDGTTNNRIYIRFNTGNTIQGVVVNGGATVALVENGPFTSGENYKVVLTYKNNSVKIFGNGVLYEEDTIVSIPACNTIGFDRGDGASIFRGFCKNLTIVPTAITDEEAIAWTTP